MCEPTTIALTGLALEAGVVALQHKAQGDRRKATVAAANKNFDATVKDINARMGEESKAAQGQIAQGQTQAGMAEGSARAAAAAAGVGGRSVDLLLQGIQRDQLAHQTSVGENLTAVEGQLARQKEQAAAARDSAIAGAPAPNPFLAGLQIAKAGVDFATYKVGRSTKGA